MIRVPHAFASATVTREGEAGRRWIDALPAIVEELCQHWHLTVDGPVMHGYLGLVIPVRRGVEPFVLKVSWLDEVTAEEAMALSVWDGHGAVWLSIWSQFEPESGGDQPWYCSSLTFSIQSAVLPSRRS